MRDFWRRLRHAKRGATAIEYGLILACIAMAMIVSLQTLNQKTGNLFGRSTAALAQ